MSKGSIILAEDEPMNAKIAIYRLEKEGYSVTHYPDGENIIEAIKDKKPSLVLLDIMLPIKDGVTILREMRANEDMKHIPVVFLSAKNNDKDIREVKDLGANGYVTKPFSPDSLIKVINGVLEN